MLKTIAEAFVKEEKEYIQKPVDKNLLKKLLDKLLAKLNSEYIYPESFSLEQFADNKIFLELEIDGDWKHDHLYCEQLVKNFCEENDIEIIGVEEKVYHEEDETSYSDDYMALHAWELFIKSDLEEDLLDNEKNVDIIKAVEEHFGTTGEPYNGPTYIMPDGKFLDLRNYSNHSDVEKWLIEQGLSNNLYEKTAGSRTLYELNCIRCNTEKYYIQLPTNVVSTQQKQSLLMWLEFLARSWLVVDVEIPSLQLSYSAIFAEETPQQILDNVLNKMNNILPENLINEEQLEETYSDDELDRMVGKVYNIRKLDKWYRNDKGLFAHTICTKCGREKEVFLSNLINDPDKYGSCICSDENIDSKIDYAQELYTGGRKLSSNTSGYTGVSFVKTYKGQPYNKWRAYIEVDGKRTYLGDFTKKKDAIKARKVAAEKGVKWYKDNKNKITRDLRRKTKKYTTSKYRDSKRKTINLKEK